MRVTRHAIEQAVDRFTSIGLDIETVGKALVAKVGSKVYESAAVLLMELSEKKFCPDGSNGDEVWAVIRDDAVITFMLRRHEQRDTLSHLNVAEVVV